MEMALNIIMCLIGSLCFGIIFQVPRRFLLLAVAIGLASVLAPTFFPEAWHPGVVTFVVAFGVGCTCNIIARYSNTPAQGLLIPGVIFLVPGAMVYRAFAAATSQSSGDASELALTAVLITIAISIGLLLANWIFPVRRML